MDQADRSFQEEQSNINEKLRLARIKHPTLKAVGYCHNHLCSEDVAEGQLFCNSDCADEYARQIALRGQIH